MSLTLKDLRVFAQEVAGKDLSSEKGDRLVRAWINAALARICSAHIWKHYTRTAYITTEPAITGAELGLTEQSDLITLGPTEVFEQRWLDERWHLHIGGEGRISFELGEIINPKLARLRSGVRWYLPDATDNAYQVSRHIYKLPFPTKRVLLFEDTFNSLTILELPNAEFDKLRQTSATWQGQPNYFTVRNGNVEVWPSAAADSRVFFMTYHRATPVYGLADVDGNDTVVDWDPNFSDLLLKAVQVEAALTQGERAPIPYQLALKEYMDRLDQCRADDANVMDITGPINRVEFDDDIRVANYPNAIPGWP